MKASAKDLRLHTAEILAAADRGETVVISYRGRRRAILQGYQEAVELGHQGRNPAFGIWADRPGDVDEEVRRLRERRDLP